MTVLLITYIIGLVVNIFMASSVYSDLKSEKMLTPWNIVLLVMSVLGSFVTWVVVIVMLIIQFLKNVRK